MIRLKQLREQTKLNQKAFAKLMNIPYTTYNFWENEKVEMDYSNLNKFADYFNVSVDYLLGREDNTGVTYPQRFIEVSDTEKQLIAEFRKSKRNAQKFLIDLDEQEENRE